MRMETVRMPDLKLNEVPNTETLLHLLRSTEHDFVERKPKKQNGDWLQTAVAFANSTPIGYPAVLFVGVDDKGVPQEREEKDGKSLEARLEILQQSITDTLNQAYPPFYKFFVPLTLDGGGCIAVVIPGSSSRPHFAGKAYVRHGSSTKESSEAQFDALIAERSSKVYELRKLIGKKALIEHFRKNYTGSAGRGPIEVVDCNLHYLTYGYGTPPKLISIPVERLALTFDHGQNTPVLQTWEPGS